MPVKMPTTMKFTGMDWFIGDQSGNVSQFDPRRQTSAGQQYIPDEVAQEMVDKLDLRKSNTVSKNTIIKYLESLGLSSLLATDVAMVLRNNYGVTPIFYEEKYMRSGQLVEELMGVLDENYPAPFLNVAPQILTEEEAIAKVVAEELEEATTEEEVLLIREFSQWSLREMEDLQELAEDFGDEGLDLLQDCYDAGGTKLMEQVVEAVYRPHLTRFMSEDVQGLAEVAVSTMIRAKAGSKKPRPDAAKEVGANLRSQGVETSREQDASAKAGRMKKAAGKAGLMMRHIGGKLKDAAGWAGKKALKGAQAVGQAHVDVAKKATDVAAGAVKHVVGHGADIAGHTAKRYAQARGKEAPAEKPAAEPAGEKKPGLLRRMIGGVSRFAGKVKRVVGGAARGGADAVKKEFPGVAKAGSSIRDKFMKGYNKTRGKKGASPEKSQASSKTKAPDVELGPAGGRRKNVNPLGATEAVDPFFAELATALGCDPSEVELEGGVPDPANIGERLYAQDVVDQTVVESLVDAGWEEIAEVANVMMLDPQHTLQLLYALREGVLPYRREWNTLTENESLPLGMSRDSMVSLGRLTLDEGVIPKVLFWASRFLQEAAGSDVEEYVRESYPELGQTVYGPAGDPKEGPLAARDYMTPHHAGAASPNHDAHVMHTRHFTDPSERAQKRSAMRKEVENIIGQMAAAADSADVAPEGMFLNKWRDMHRERARYS